MKDKELKLNASGYYDEPCYKVITASPKPGEIWTHAATGYHMLIVSTLNGVCSTLRLTDVEREGCIPVTGRTLMFATPIILGYSFESTLGNYVKSIKNDEFEKVKRGIVKVLGLQDFKADVKEAEIVAADMLEEHTTRDKLEAEYAELLDKNRSMKKEMALMKNEMEAREKARILLDESFEKVSREADKAEIYKEMYMTLLDKVIAARGCVNE